MRRAVPMRTCRSHAMDTRVLALPLPFADTEAVFEQHQRSARARGHIPELLGTLDPDFVGEGADAHVIEVERATLPFEVLEHVRRNRRRRRERPEARARWRGA